MTTSNSPNSATNLAAVPGAQLLPLIGRALESLWLLSVFLVPLTFLGQEYVVSEAQIAYAEVPKVALLRALAGVILLLWAFEWALKSNTLENFSLKNFRASITSKLRPQNLVSLIRNWLGVHPTRWLLFAAGLFFGSTFLSTVLSGSFTTSMWGEIPGQDGYSTYTVASYGILFGVIATHLKTRSQVGRLLGAVVLMGFLVGLYGSLQHYGHDFFNITESTGGGTSRVTIFMGNTIFAGAVLSMTVPITLMVAAINLNDDSLGNWKPLSKLGQLGRDTMFTYLWALTLAVQLMGLMFTFSRGPWGGTVLALSAFLVLLVISFGWRTLIRSALVLGLAGTFAVGFLHWQGNVSIINFGSWLGFLLILMGLVGTFAVLFFIRRFGRAVIFVGAIGAAVVIVGASLIAPSALSNRGGSESAGQGTTGGQVSDRLTSIKTDVLGGFIGGRGTHWKISWELIKNRPWFQFEDLSFSWLRPFIGYGPDLFRYTYLLESPADGPDQRPLEPDHAHNFFIHQTVEQGILGGGAALALFLSVIAVVGRQILTGRKLGDPLYRMLLFGLMAVILGRFLEMTVGVARISDLTVLWAIFGLFAALISIDTSTEPAKQADEETPSENPPTRRASARNRRNAARASVAQSTTTGLMFRLAIVAWLLGGMGVVTWQKSINSVRASVAEGRALVHFREGNLESSLVELDNAIALAPGVPSYYNNRAQIFLLYQIRADEITEPNCANQTETPYLTCLGLQARNTNLEAVRQQPYNFRVRIAAGNSAFNLSLNEIAIESYMIASDMVPNAFSILNELADSQMDVGRPGEALMNLNRSLAITGGTTNSIQSLTLKGEALLKLERFDESYDVLKSALFLSPSSGFTKANLDFIHEINVARGVSLDLVHFDSLIETNPDDMVAYYNRGLANLVLGNSKSASEDLDIAYMLGLTLGNTDAHRGRARIDIGEQTGALKNLTAAMLGDPQNALYHAYLGDLHATSKNYSEALNFLETANIIDPNLGLAYLIRSRVFMELGLEESAQEFFEIMRDMELPTAQDYVDRGEIHAFFGDYDATLADINKALEISPKQARFYDARGKALASMNDFVAAISDFDTAIGLDSTKPQFFINRGVAQELLGRTELALADFESALSFGPIDIPEKINRNPSFFLTYHETESSDSAANQLAALQIKREALRDIEYNSTIPSDHPDYLMALQFIGEANLTLNLWESAVKSFTQLLELAPYVPEGYKVRGDAFKELKRYEDALEDYDRAIALNGSNGDYFLARGQAYAESGEYELARNDFNQAIDLDPNPSAGYAHRGYLSVLSGDPESAIPDLNTAIEISPINDDAYFKRAIALHSSGSTNLALKDLEKALELAPSNTEYLYNRGAIRLELADFDSGIEDLTDAITLELNFFDPYTDANPNTDPRHTRPYIARAAAYLVLGELTLALDDANTTIRYLKGNINSSDWEIYWPTITLLLADAYELQGDIYTAQGRNSSATTSYETASELRSN